VLEQAPQWRLASAHLAAGSEQRVQDELAASYPNVTLIRLREMLEQVASVLGRVGAAVRFLGAFTAIAGIAILAGAVSAGEARRRRDAALLKTLGMTRFGVARAFAGEYALVGLVAGLVGTAAGVLIARLVLIRGMDMKYAFEAPAPLTTLVLTVVLSVAAGLAASIGALRRRPIETLRME
jgi:putative ABC transport system permease protein